MSAYHCGFAVAVINSKNQIQRELAKNGVRTVRLPFDSEYKLRLKNKTKNTAIAEIFIDGMSASLDGKKLVLPPETTIDVERFVDTETQGPRLKFVKPDHADVQDPTTVEIGRIRVVFYPQVKFEEFPRIPSYPWWIYQPVWYPTWPSLVLPISPFYSSPAPEAAFDATSSGFALGGQTTFMSTVDTKFSINGVSSTATGATVGGTDAIQSFKLSDTVSSAQPPVTMEIQLEGYENIEIKVEVKMRNGLPYKVFIDDKELTQCGISLDKDGLVLKLKNFLAS